MALIGVGGTVIGTLLGVLIAHYLSLRLTNIIDRRNANRNLIATFYRELADIYPTPVNWPDDINDYLTSKFATLQAAIGEFRYHIPSQEWNEFDNAWFNYYCSSGREVDKKHQNYRHYMDMNVETTNNLKSKTQNGQKTFKYNVDRILKFAEKI